MEAFVVQAFATLFVVIDPVGVAPVFTALTQGVDPIERRAMAVRGALVATLILVVFAVAGEWLLDALGITLPAFRVGGGILLMLVSIDMVFARRSGVRQPTGPEETEARHRDDISVFPLAFPLIGGPGAMTSVVLLSGGSIQDPARLAVLLIVLLVVLAMTLAFLLGADRVLRLLGVTGVNVIGRVFGVILAALAAQFIIDGIRQSLSLG